MKTGKIKTLTEKGYGFIAIEGQAKDMFFHSSQLQNVRFDDLNVGDVVEFDVEKGDKGEYAANISLVN